MSNGVLKAANDKEIPSKQKKWPVPGGATGGAIYIPDKYVTSYSLQLVKQDLDVTQIMYINYSFIPLYFF